MKMPSLCLVFAIMLSCASNAQNPIERDLIKRVDDLILAQISFDPKKLDHLLSDEFIEISPKGEFDTKAKVLKFYQPMNKTKFVPAIEKSVLQVSYVENMAYIALTETFKAPNSDATLFSMRVIFTLKQIANEWKFTYAQYTPIVANSKSQ
ncbi:hypothetical protein tinsulaeT_19310 [Thalassotalea insulae]|uniref:DUF4440 domain-containing protein n=1 Tax=Thalassotalea insulae TaxID=2056778 RepID=A0ABQ6GWR1_9GAMM|nr:nuclear transport factor 2 family protein [Thalassotalea insulae]GLX78591.1 hypothetical protein tinsulaeT_19310 [Thalassotalea insulae]